MTRLVHSYWTRPLSIRRYGLGFTQLSANVWYFALSVAYAKLIGAEIVLHTDTLGKALLGHLPYDEIHLTLDDVPAHIHPRFWAAGKFYALEREPIGAVHIDGDVFLKRSALLDLMSGCDVIVQHKESAGWYDTERMMFKFAPEVARFGINVDFVGGYNTGVFGMNNAEYKRRFLAGYFGAVDAISRNFYQELSACEWSTPDLITEQQWARQLAEDMNLRVSCILPDEMTIHETAKQLGYQHVVTSAKYSVVDRVQATLNNVNKDIYHKTELLCRNI